MGKLGKIFVILVVGLVGLVLVAAVSMLLFFDPNDFREDIAAAVREETGRELVIEGEISLSLFPWLAVGIGRTELGNADGFGDEPFIAFDNAELSVRVLPLVFEQRIAVGTASLDGFVANLTVDAAGRTNWDDLSERGSASQPAEPAQSTDGGNDFGFDIANIALNDAHINFDDREAGARYSITGLSVSSGRITHDEPFDVSAGFDFSAEPDDVDGRVDVAATITMGQDRLAIDGFDIEATVSGVVSEPTEFFLSSRAISIDMTTERVDLGEIDLGALGLTMSADVEPFATAGSTVIESTLRVNDFSLKELLATLDIEAPETADPNALTTLSFEATAKLDDDVMTLSGMNMVMDDTTMQGDMVIPLTPDGALVFDLRADSITLDNYLAPPAEAEATDTGEEAVDVVIPADLVRSLNANGSVRMDQAFLGPITFTNMALGINSADDRLRLNPITAEFFDGAYNGDIRIDASGSVPALSVDERIDGVNLSSMAKALFGNENITGTIEGHFRLAGAGETLSAVSADMDGDMRFVVADGVWAGVDVWHQLRTARALFKREAPPEPRAPVRTEFTAISMTGTVTDGMFRSNDLKAELPFLQITGNGQIDIPNGLVDYSVLARVLENPEFMGDASDDELLDFTDALIPIKVSGSLSSPSFRPDIEAVFRQQVEQAIEDKAEELKRDLLNQLMGGEEDESGEGTDTEEEDKDVEDVLEDALKDLFPR